MSSAGEPVDLRHAAALRLPDGARLVRTTPEFDAASVPGALLSAHRVADGVWGRLVVLAGEVRFTFEAAPTAGRILMVGDQQVIPPGELHRVEPGDGCRFLVEFHRIEPPGEPG